MTFPAAHDSRTNAGIGWHRGFFYGAAGAQTINRVFESHRAPMPPHPLRIE